MARVKGGVTASKRRRNILKAVKGYRFGRSTKKRQAREAIRHAGKYAFAHRRKKKRDFRELFTIRLNAALREQGTTFSKFMGVANKKGLKLNRKMLSDIAQRDPAAFARIVKKIS